MEPYTKDGIEFYKCEDESRGKREFFVGFKDGKSAIGNTEEEVFMKLKQLTEERKQWKREVN